MRILLIEDHADSRRNLRRLIEQRGHEVVACASAEEAEAELAKGDRFPFLILDWMLPGKKRRSIFAATCARGRTATKCLSSSSPRRTDPEDLEQALAAGANDYLTKPLDARRLNVRLSVAERHIIGLQERNQARARAPGFRSSA